MKYLGEKFSMSMEMLIATDVGKRMARPFRRLMSIRYHNFRCETKLLHDEVCSVGLIYKSITFM